MSIIASSLKSSLEFLNLIYDTIPTGILIVDKNAKIQSFNNSLSNIFKKAEEDLIDKLCGNGIGCAFEVESNLDCGCTQYCNDCPLRNGILKSINEGQSTENKLLKRNFYIEGNNIVKYFNFYIKPLITNNEKFSVIFFNDVTEFYELAEKRNELLGIAAHDIRNPLSIIKMYVDFIKTHTEPSNTKIDQAYVVIDESFNYMIELLNDILSFASFEKSEVKLQYMLYDYISFVQSIVNLQQMIASEKKIKIIFESSIESLKFQFDNNRITQVLTNLISNAIKYSFENSQIHIRISIDQHSSIVKTEVIDNGPGIDKEQQTKLFKPFSRTNIRPTGNETSTGLGLAIAKKIILAHKGEIGVISEPSKGSNFWFNLPIII